MPQYEDTDSDSSSDEHRERVIDTNVATNDINNDDFQQISNDNNDNDNDSNQLEAVFADNIDVDEQPFSDTLTTVEVSIVTEKSTEIPYNPSSSSSLLATSAALNSLPLSRESQSKPVSSSSSSSSSSSPIVTIPDTSVNTIIKTDIKDDSNINTSLQVQNANINLNSIESTTIDTVASAGIITSDIDNKTNASTMEVSAISVIIPITTGSLDLGSELAFNSSIKNDKIVDTELSSINIDTNARTKTSASKQLPEIEQKGVRIYRKKADLESDSDVSDDERSIPIPISYISVSQMSGEIVASKGEPSVNLSAFSAELPADGNTKKAVKFDESTEKLTIVTSSVDKHAEKTRDDLKWHLADQPKVNLIVFFYVFQLLTLIVYNF